MNNQTEQTTKLSRTQWDTAAEGWDSQAPVLAAWLAGPTETMLSMAAISSGAHVLDIAAGAGEQTLALAARVGPQGRILATDLSPALITRLRSHTAQAGYSMVDARVADAQEPLAEIDTFDAAVCRLGLMLMPEPARCLTSTHKALKPGGHFSAMVFAAPQDNPCLRIVMMTAQKHAGLPPRDPFEPGGLLSLGRPGHLEQLFQAAGFRETSTFRIDAPFRLPSVDDYIVFLRAAAAPVRAILSCLDEPAQEDAWNDMRGQLAAFNTPGGWSGPNTLLLITGKK